ncbi:MAG: hypothetical protein IT315_08415 [Anaerolineales bacterium]|nr:hypothetical protein [Anaerolineales bacterium]
MSGISESRQPQSRRKFALIVIVVTIISLFAYGGGLIALPLSILSNYQSRNCESVLAQHGIYTTLYPAFLEDQTLSDPVMECALYTLANIEHGEESWAGSYNAYKVYESRYPHGVLANDVHQQAALSLTNLIKEQISAKKFPDALTNLNLVSASYDDTESAQIAFDFFPQLYTAWGQDLRSAGRFEEALGVYGDYKSWAEKEQAAEHSKLAQAEIAQTYLDWGLQLQSQKKFQEAESKFESARSANPTLAEKVQANEEKFYTEWGNFLIEQGDFALAMEQYELAAKLAEQRDPLAAKDVLANGYIQWAGGLSAEEDFIGALVLLDFALENAATDSVKTSVDEARTETYLAFSKSDGEQAQKAMKDAVAIVCQHHINPRLAIFGLNSSAIHAGVYGTDQVSPEPVIANSPGEMHYVACISKDTRIVSRELHHIPDVIVYANLPPVTLNLFFSRVKYIWNVSLRDINTGNEVTTTIIEAVEPPMIDPGSLRDHIKNPFYYGPEPDIADLTAWLLTVLK